MLNFLCERRLVVWVWFSLIFPCIKNNGKCYLGFSNANCRRIFLLFLLVILCICWIWQYASMLIKTKYMAYTIGFRFSSSLEVCFWIFVVFIYLFVFNLKNTNLWIWSSNWFSNSFYINCVQNAYLKEVKMLILLFLLCKEHC